MQKTLCFTGPRPKKLYGYNREEYNELLDFLKNTVLQYIKAGYTTFITGGAQGFDQLAFWAVNSLKKEYPEIKNVLYLPCKNQDIRWAEEGPFSRKDYQLMLKYADDIKYVHNRNFESPRDLFDRNHAMVDDSIEILGMYPDNGWRTEKNSGTAECMRYALKKDIYITRLVYDNHKHYHTYTEVLN